MGCINRQQPFSLLHTPFRMDHVVTLDNGLTVVKNAPGIRPLARQFGRDPTAVLRDLVSLEQEGIIEKNEDAK